MAAGFMGIRTLPLRTFTTTFSAINGAFAWNANALQPMEFAGKILITGPTFQSVAFGCTVFDSATGSTRWTFGNMASGSFNNNFGNILWKRGNDVSGYLRGWIWNEANTQKPNNFSYPVTFGVPVSGGPFAVSTLFQTPSTVNSAVPDPGAGSNSGNWYDSRGFIFTTWRDQLVQKYMDWNGYGGITQLGSVVAQLSATKRFTVMVPYGEYDYVWCEDSTGPGTKIMMRTNWVNVAQNWTPQLAVPAGGSSIDLTAYINNPLTSAPTACYGGFLWLNKNTATIGNKVLNGFGIYVNPDFGFYYILEIIPTDANAANWNVGIGDVQGKWDDLGALWIKNVNSATTIFVTTPEQYKVKEIFPPTPLPSPPDDSEIPVKMLRGETA